MTPKEKALELYNRMVVDFKIDKWQSKQCALIAVDEIFQFMKMDDDLYEVAHFANSIWVKYWVEVKQEIENL